MPRPIISLVEAVCTSEEVWSMVDELLDAQAEWLPQHDLRKGVSARKTPASA